MVILDMVWTKTILKLSFKDETCKFKPNEKESGLIFENMNPSSTYTFLIY